MEGYLDGYSSSDSDTDNYDSARKELTASVNAMMTRQVESYNENCKLLKLRFQVKNRSHYVKLGIIININAESTYITKEYYITNTLQIARINHKLTSFYDRWKDEYTYETNDRD